MIETAILLAAGKGSRLRSAAPLKPLCVVAGRTLLAHALFGLAEAGLTRAVVVLGYGADQIETYLKAHLWPLAIETALVEDYHKPNGSSLLAAERHLEGGQAVLAMCDHLVDPRLYRRMALAGSAVGARLAIDRRIESDWIDLDDVTCVRTDRDRIVAIGKGLAEYDCFDTGVFAIGPALFGALHDFEAPSLTEGMRALAQERAALVEDCSDLDWMDVDEERSLMLAERWWTSRNEKLQPNHENWF